MTNQSRRRLLTTLSHQEADRIPLDLGSTQVTGIHIQAYSRLRSALGFHIKQTQLCDYIQQLAMPDEDMLEYLGADVRGLFPRNSHNWGVKEIWKEGGWFYRDEWGIIHRRSSPDGLYYNLYHAPLDKPQLTLKEIETYPWPDMGDHQRIDGLEQQAQQSQAAGYAVVLKDPFAGIFEMAQRIIGFERLLILLASKNILAEALFEKILELKMAFWEMSLPKLGDLVNVVSQTDDYGTQTSLLISPTTARLQFIKRWKVIFARIKELAPHIHIFFHSCGSIRPLIPDLIEIGVEILNPVHVSASGMEPAGLKRDFGKALTFWGGGVDTQRVLPYGKPQEVQDNVRRNIEALAPGGGFVFTPVHNIQADVPVENMLAMWEALRAYGGCV